MKALNKLGKLLFMTLSLFTSLKCTKDHADQRQKSPYFKNGAFHNKVKSEKSLWQALKMRFTTDWPSWPKFVESQYGPKPKSEVSQEEVVLTHINHATVLIQSHGYNILTDPIYSDSCSPVPFVIPDRVVKPGIKFEDLPKIHMILISHDHYDHLDLPTLNDLIARDNPKIFVGLGVGKRLPEKAKQKEMDWWQEEKIGKNLNLHFVPVQHFSGRTPFDRNSTLWGGFVLEFEKIKVYFGGDTGYSDYFLETYKKFGPMDVSLLPIGAYKPRSFMGHVHMDPKEAVQAHLDLKSKLSIGIHYGTFQLTAEPINEPKELLEEEKKKAGVNPEAFLAVDFGKPVVFKANTSST